MVRAAVLDACVLYPITLTDVLLRSAEHGFFLPQWSNRILEEVRRNIIANGKCSPSDADQRISDMQQAFPEAMVTGWEPLESQMTNDPKDRHVLAAAVHAKVGIIVTKNVRDFPRESCHPHGVEVLEPDDLLIEFLMEAHDDMIQLLYDQASDMQYPPCSFEELLGYLRRHAPTFIDLVAKSLDDAGIVPGES